MKNKGYAKSGGTNKLHYGRCTSGVCWFHALARTQTLSKSTLKETERRNPLAFQTSNVVSPIRTSSNRRLLVRSLVRACFMAADNTCH